MSPGNVRIPCASRAELLQSHQMSSSITYGRSSMSKFIAHHALIIFRPCEKIIRTARENNEFHRLFITRGKSRHYPKESTAHSRLPRGSPGKPNSLDQGYTCSIVRWTDVEHIYRTSITFPMTTDDHLHLYFSSFVIQYSLTQCFRPHSHRDSQYLVQKSNPPGSLCNKRLRRSCPTADDRPVFRSTSSNHIVMQLLLCLHQL